MFSDGRLSTLCGSTKSTGALPSAAKARDAAARVTLIRKVVSQPKRKENHSREQQRGFPRKVKDTVASPTEPWRGLWSQCQGVRDRAGTMETFRLVPHTHTNMPETARTERSLFLADAWRDFLFAAAFSVCGFPYGNAFFPFNLHPQAQWILLQLSKHMVHTSKT